MKLLKTFLALLLLGSVAHAQTVTTGQNPKNTITGPSTFIDDVELRFGTGGTTTCEWSTTDANANAMVCAGPEGGAVDVPVFVFGDATCNALDIALFNGLTNGTIAAMNDACTGGTYFSHNGTDGTMTTSTGDLLFNISGANLAPSANDGSALGISGTAFSDLFLASGAVINFLAADVTITHSSNTLAFAGASSGYTFDADVTSTACSSIESVEYNPTEAGATDDYVNLMLSGLTSSAFSATETDQDMFMVPRDMIARDLRAEVNAAPGVGNDAWVITLRDDAASSTLTCTIDEAATNCSDTTNAPALVAGSKLDILVISSGPGADPNTAATMNISFCLGQ